MAMKYLTQKVPVTTANWFLVVWTKLSFYGMYRQVYLKENG
jgi:hypothetical protein